jgi:hypothetical protein
MSRSRQRGARQLLAGVGPDLLGQVLERAVELAVKRLVQAREATEVVQCIVGAFAKIRFPNPEGGMVTVVYPIILSPG